MSDPIADEFAEHERVTLASRSLLPLLTRVADLLCATLDHGGRVFACGNGGSAGHAQHFVAELVGRYRLDRRALAAYALTADTLVLTAVANDQGFDTVFARQIEALARPGDALVALSTSGRSRNVIAAVDRARALGCSVVAFTGADEADFAGRCDVVICAPSHSVPRIQEVHAFALHAVAHVIELRATGSTAA